MNKEKAREGLEYFAIFATIVGGLIALFNYIESRKSKELQEKNLALEKEIKELQLTKLRKEKT